MENLQNKVITATKWSSITEILSKLITPISTMILARILAPDAFGVMVTATMVISFAEIFTDAGFQKYIIQHDFKSREELYKSTNVAFLANFTFSVLIWIGIIIFSEQIATLVGNDGYGSVIAVSCFAIPLAAFSSIQMALYKRDLDFRSLFVVRSVGIVIPIIVTIPVALLTHSYWALIIGMLVTNISNAIILTVKSKWKPNLFFSIKLFKEMFSFSFLSMIEAITIWMTSYIDMFIVGTMLNQHYLGIYRTSMSTVGQLTGLITAATTPILFSSLSKLQNNDEELKKMFFSFQKIVGVLVIPIGFGIFLFRDLITSIFLGSQWGEASYFIGLWGLTSSITIVLSHYASELYRAKGKPILSVIAQIVHICCLVPAVLWAVKYDFKTLCEVRALVRLTLIAINLIILYFFMRISFGTMLKNIFPSLIAGGVMTVCVLILLHLNDNFILQFVYCIIAAVIYFLVLLLFPPERKIILNLKHYLKR